MFLCSFEVAGRTRLGLRLQGDTIADLTLAYERLLMSRGQARSGELAELITPSDLMEFIKGGSSSLRAAQEVLDYASASAASHLVHNAVFDVDKVRIRPPLDRPGKILCPAVNHRDLFDRAMHPPNPHPIYFLKPATCIIGPGDPIEIPDVGTVSQEVELAVIIGKNGKRIPREKAFEHVFGYTIFNDVTAHQLREEREWIALGDSSMRLTYPGRYKGYDTFAPIGPWVATKDEIRDPHRLRMVARIGGIVVQSGSTEEMVYPIPELIESMSEVHTLEPGDIITTGTCKSAPGYSLGKYNIRDMVGPVELEIEGLGVLRNPIKPI